MEKMMQKLKLTVNPQKTRVCQVPEESFDFLGYTLGRCYRAKIGTPYIGSKPSKKAVTKLCQQIGQMTRAHAELEGNGGTGRRPQLSAEGLGQLLPTWVGQ